MFRPHADSLISVRMPVLAVPVWAIMHVLVCEAQKRGYEVASERFYTAIAAAFNRLYCIWWVDRRVRSCKLAIRYRAQLATATYV